MADFPESFSPTKTVNPGLNDIPCDAESETSKVF